MNASFSWTENIKKFHLAASDNTREFSPCLQALCGCLAFHFLPHSYMLISVVVCAISHWTASTEKTGSSSSVWTILQDISWVTMNDFHKKSSTSNTEVLDFAHIYRIFSMQTLESQLMFVKALEMLFMCCMTASCSQWASTYHLTSLSLLDTQKN